MSDQDPLNDQWTGESEPRSAGGTLVEPVPIEPPLPTPTDRRAEGKARRTQAPRRAHSGWKAPANRPDPIQLLEESNRHRLPKLVPIRYGRMLISPFTFLRGSPIVMANDLATTPVSGIRVQACGDAHLMNFGLYGSPERNLLFDINDFDETLPAPWEWDVKRLAASCVVAGRTFGRRSADCFDAARACARFYREQMRRYSRMRLLDVWYSRVDAVAVQRLFRNAQVDMERSLDKARSRTTLQALAKLAAVRDGRIRLVETPPLVSHVDDESLCVCVRRVMAGYYPTLSDDRRALIQRFRFVDFALKVVGVGSVGTRCFVVLMDASHHKDPLLLQIKEACTSVLEPYAGRSVYRNHGRRVVNGQRLIQSASDIFLGWTSDGSHDYYVRQLRDMKGTADLSTMIGSDLIVYAELCGWVLARAHARSGDADRISGYLGKSPAFEDAIARFAKAYADQNEADFEALQAAVKSGRVAAETGV